MKNKGDNRNSFAFDNQWSAKQMVDHASLLLDQAGSEAPGREARWLYCNASGQTAASFLVSRGQRPNEQVLSRFIETIGRRLNGEPLQYILGKVEFRNVVLNVDDRVLIPRPESEALVDLALKLSGGRQARILDVGTGSGCLAIALKSELPGADVWAIDISDDALEVAKGNADLNDVDISFRRCDVFEEKCIDSLGVFDLLVSNPPYIPEDSISDLHKVVVDYEPLPALTPGPDSLAFYKRFAEIAERIIVPGGSLVVEVHSPNAGLVRELFSGCGLYKVRVESDLAGKPRVVLASTSRR